MKIDSYGVLNAARLYGRDYTFLLKSRIKGIFRNNEAQSIILCNSYPKSGTHLLAQVLAKVDGYTLWNDIVSFQSLSGVINRKSHIRDKMNSAPERSIVRSHLMYDDEINRALNKRRTKKIFIYRDLRDVVVSHARWVNSECRYFLNEYYRNCSSDEERVMLSIVGIVPGTPVGSNISTPPIGRDFERWKGWISDEDTLSVKFEDLVGERGGGSEETKICVIREILDFLEVELSEEDVRQKFSIIQLDPSKSHTFRKGRIGAWREIFTEEHKKAFKAEAGNMLIELGYEKNMEW